MNHVWCLIDTISCIQHSLLDYFYIISSSLMCSTPWHIISSTMNFTLHELYASLVLLSTQHNTMHHVSIKVHRIKLGVASFASFSITRPTESKVRQYQ